MLDFAQVQNGFNKSDYFIDGCKKHGIIERTCSWCPQSPRNKVQLIPYHQAAGSYFLASTASSRESNVVLCISSKTLVRDKWPTG